MEFKNPLKQGILIQRYKRFLADIELPTEGRVTAHCANPGSMKTCAEPGAIAWVSESPNLKRKLRYTWELVRLGETTIFVNPVRANDLAFEALERGTIAELGSYDTIQREARCGLNSRIDFLLRRGDEQCFVEVKSVTLKSGPNTAAFPDAPTLRGRKHLDELMAVKRAGHRAVLLFSTHRSDAEAVVPADDIDPEYGRKLREAHSLGVELLAYKARMSEYEIRLERALPVRL